MRSDEKEADKAMNENKPQNKPGHSKLDLLVQLVKDKKIPISSHSGKIEEGGIFVVLPAPVPKEQMLNTPGGEIYLEEVAKKNPSCLIIEKRHADLARKFVKENTDIILCESTRVALGKLASAYYDTDEKCPSLIGVTGTNGKTTESYLLEALFASQGIKTGIIGTVEYRWPHHQEVSSLTTPGCLELHHLLKRMTDAGTEKTIMEVSSHAIDQKRVAGLKFSAALISNLTQDHLDYHKDMEDYFQAKAKLFLPEKDGGLPLDSKVGAVNADDSWCRQLLEKHQDLVGYGLRSEALKRTRHLAGKILSMTPERLQLEMNYEGKKWQILSPLVGEFNAMNLLAVQALALATGMDYQAFSALEKFAGVPGRMERILNSQELGLFVDYAHTPDALIKAQEALKEAGFNRLITVFGCGGNRDRSKRPLMGEAVAALSDIAVLTSDNPRLEEPEAIMDDVMPGLKKCKKVIRQVDRKKAIQEAFGLMKAGDALLVAGKGHETYQIIGKEKRPFSDKEILKELSS